MILKRTTAFIIFILLGNGVIFGQVISADSVRKLVAIYKPLLETDTIDYEKRKVTKLNENLFKIEDRYASGKLAALKFSKSFPYSKQFLTTLTNSEYYENANLKSTKTHADDNIFIKEYFRDGSIYRIYLEKEFQTVWKTGEVYDSNNTQVVMAGNGLSKEFITFDKESHIAIGEYKDSLKVGEWKGFYEDGQLYFTELFNSGTLVSGVSFDRDGNRYNYDKEFLQPEFIGGEKALGRYLARNVNYLQVVAKEGVSGRVVIQFTVTKLGKVSEITVLNDAPTALVKESLRVVKSMSGKWIPGKRKGIPKDMFFTLPIVYSMVN